MTSSVLTVDLIIPLRMVCIKTVDADDNLVKCRIREGTLEVVDTVNCVGNKRYYS